MTRRRRRLVDRSPWDWALVMILLEILFAGLVAAAIIVVGVLYGA